MEYPSNSDLSRNAQDKPEEKVLNKVHLSGGVEKRKKTAAQKIAGIFIQDDIQNVKEYVLTDVIIPTIKETILNTISMFFYGEVRGGRGSGYSRSQSTVGSRVTYSNYGSYFDDKYKSSTRKSTATGFEFDDLSFKTRGDAQGFLFEMRAALDRYKTLSVFEMYDMAGEVAPHTYHNYGWTSLENAKVVPIHGGRYVIDLPKALPMERR